MQLSDLYSLREFTVRDRSVLPRNKNCRHVEKGRCVSKKCFLVPGPGWGGRWLRHTRELTLVAGKRKLDAASLSF